MKTLYIVWLKAWKKKENQWCNAGRFSSWGRRINSFSTAAAAIDEPIHPSIQVDHTQLLINGQFVDAASG